MGNLRSNNPRLKLIYKLKLVKLYQIIFEFQKMIRKENRHKITGQKKLNFYGLLPNKEGKSLENALLFLNSDIYSTEA